MEEIFRKFVNLKKFSRIRYVYKVQFKTLESIFETVPT